MRKSRMLLFAIFWPCLLAAQSPPLLTLEECIARAEQNSYQLQSDDYEISAAEHNAALIHTQILPKLEGELATENRFLKPFNFNQTWAEIHADWSLGDYLKKTGRAANQDVITQRLLKEQNRLEIISRSTSLYMGILQIMKQIDIISIRLALLQKHRDLSEGLWKAGIRSQLDVLQTESDIVQLREDTSHLAMVREELRDELIQLLGWDEKEPFRLMPLDVASIANKPVPSLSGANLLGNPFLASFDSKVKAQNFRAEEMLAEKYPHLRMGTGLFGDGDPSGDGSYFLINAGVVIPIFYKHEPELKQRWSEAIVQSLGSQKMDAERELMIQLTKVNNKLQLIKDLLQLQNERKGIAIRGVQIAEVNYQSGISSNLDYLRAQEQVTNIELSLEETYLEYTMNLIEYYVNTNQIDQILSLGK